MNYLSSDRWTALQYYSKVFQIKTYTDGRYVHMEVYSGSTPGVLVEEKIIWGDRGSYNDKKIHEAFEDLKTKHIFDYENIYTTTSPKESRDSGVYNFKDARSRILGRRGKDWEDGHGIICS